MRQCVDTTIYDVNWGNTTGSSSTEALLILS